MKKLLCYIFVLSLLIGVPYLYAGDKVNYGPGGLFTKTRQVAENVFGASFNVGTTSISVTLPRQTLSVRVINDDTTATDLVYVNPTGNVALNINNDNATTTAGSKIINLNLSLSDFDIEIGQLIVLDEGDANDGIYAVIRLDGTTTVHLDRNLTVSHSGNQDFKITSPSIRGTQGKHTFFSGSKEFSFIATTSATPIRIEVAYQKNS